MVWTYGEVVKLKVIFTLLVPMLQTGLEISENFFPLGKSLVDLTTIPEPGCSDCHFALNVFDNCKYLLEDVHNEGLDSWSIYDPLSVMS